MQYEVKRTARGQGAREGDHRNSQRGRQSAHPQRHAGKNAGQGQLPAGHQFRHAVRAVRYGVRPPDRSGRQARHVTSPIMEIEVVPGYEVKLARNEIESEPGGKLEIAGKVHREPTFEGGLIKLQAEDLPDHVTCAPVEVAADQKDFTLTCSAEATAKPGSFPIRISSVAPDTGKKAKADYKIPDLDSDACRVGKTSWQASRIT